MKTVKIGDERYRYTTLDPGIYRIDESEDFLEIEKKTRVRMKQRFSYKPGCENIKYDPDWRNAGFEWSEAEAESPEPAVVRLSWWRRLFARRIPAARLLRG